MILLLSLISVMALLFIFSDRMLFRENGAVSGRSLLALLAGGMAAYFLPHAWSDPVSRILLSLPVLFYSFILLGIIPAGHKTIERLRQRSHGIYGFTIILLWAVSGIPFPRDVAGVLIFSISLVLVLKFSEKRIFSFMDGKNSQNVYKILELFHLLGGIFLFITVLIVASDRVRFLRKIVDYFF